MLSSVASSRAVIMMRPKGLSCPTISFLCLISSRMARNVTMISKREEESLSKRRKLMRL